MGIKGFITNTKPNSTSFKKGHIPWHSGTKGLGIKKTWNKGLTKETDERVRRYGLSVSKTQNKEFYMKHPEILQRLKNNRAKQIFPQKDTSIEVKIQNFLKQLGIEFYSHHSIKDIKHGYQCDIMIPVQEGIDKKTIIECFGNYWHNYPLARDIDIRRCIELRNAGWRVLVFWENEIKLMELNDLQVRL